MPKPGSASTQLMVPTTKHIIDRIEVAVSQTFTHSDKLINQFSRFSAQPAKEFETWARPRDLEKRKQAISVWTSLLAFLVFNWNWYGAQGALESMGFNLSLTLKEDIGAIRYYKSGRSLKDLDEMANTFFVKMIKDATATVHTNPLVWWLVVLIQIEVLDDLPRWTVADLQDTLSFSQKLEAIDHYAWVLVLEDAIFRWIDMPGHASPAEETQKLQDSLIGASISWIDQDAERPLVDPLVEVQSRRQMALPE